jgi:4-hydroxy-tetrahydrodipicolinate synthase
MLTPFKDNEKLDEESIREYTRWLIESGVHGLFPNSSMGEAPKLLLNERKKIINIVVDEANGKVPVCAGTGEISTKATLELTKYAKDVGADAAVIVEPYYFHPSKEALLDHYRTISEKVDIPIIVYDIPEATGYSLSPELVTELTEISNVKAIKNSSCDMIKFIREVRLVGDKISVLQGAESLFVASLVMGGAGGILGIASACPRFTVEIYDEFIKGNIKKAVDMQMKLDCLVNEFEKYNYIQAVKQSINLQGIRFGGIRKPDLPLKEKQKEDIKRVLLQLDFLSKINATKR